MFQILHRSFLGHAMVKIGPLFPICQTFHFIGLCLLIGALMVVDLRLLGVMKRMPMAVALKFIPVAVAGFVVNALTGLCFIAFDPDRYWSNWMFKLKMLLIVLAGLNALWFAAAEQRRVLALGPGLEPDRMTKITAALSLMLWVLVILTGRLLPVTQTTVAG